MSDDPAPAYWRELGKELEKRIETPSKHPTFVFYFISIIFLIGGFGIIEVLVRYYLMNSMQDAEFRPAILSGLYTYFTAIAATAAVDLILSFYKKKFLLMFFVLVSVIVFAMALAALLSRTFAGGLLCCLVGYILSLFLWWIGNADNANLLDTPAKPEAAIGGAVDQTISGSMGDLRG